MDATFDAGSDDWRQAALQFIRQRLGPASEHVLTPEAAWRDLAVLVEQGRSTEDAVLSLVHKAARDDRSVAEEFARWLSDEIRTISMPRPAPVVRTVAGTEDLVQSVLGDLWPSLFDLEFIRRSSFLSLIIDRMRWKAAGKRRSLHAAKRSEDKRVAEGPVLDEPALDQRTPLSNAAYAESRERFARLLDLVSERDRTILTLLDQGADGETVARELALEPAAARQAIKRAIDRARKHAT